MWLCALGLILLRFPSRHAHSSPGDFIVDTPAEEEPAYGCEEARDSCQDEAGLDPIHNFMNLSNDPCMFEFTDGQFAWMYAIWDYYRVQMDDGTPLVAQTTVAPTFAQATAVPTFSPTTDQPTAPPTTGAPTLEPTSDPTSNPTPKVSSFGFVSITLPTLSPTGKWDPAVASLSVALPPKATHPANNATNLVNSTNSSLAFNQTDDQVLESPILMDLVDDDGPFLSLSSGASDISRTENIEVEQEYYNDEEEGGKL
jgi:hypothetical protein